MWKQTDLEMNVCCGHDSFEDWWFTKGCIKIGYSFFMCV